MKKGTILSILALLVAITGLLIALIAYFKRRSCALCDDMDSDLMEFYDDDDCCCGGDCGTDCCCEPATEDAAPAVEEDIKF